MMSRRPSPLDTENCRSCTSFSDYVKVARRRAANEENGQISGGAALKEPRDDCPLDKDELGRGTWGLLHTMAAKYPDRPSRSEQSDMRTFLQALSKFYPCDHCAEDFRKELSQNPPEVGSQEGFSQWLCHFHNKVNTKLGKDNFDCSKINERWRDGWEDGSCDY